MVKAVSRAGHVIKESGGGGGGGGGGEHPFEAVREVDGLDFSSGGVSDAGPDGERVRLPVLGDRRHLRGQVGDDSVSGGAAGVPKGDEPVIDEPFGLEGPRDVRVGRVDASEGTGKVALPDGERAAGVAGSREGLGCDVDVRPSAASASGEAPTWYRCSALMLWGSMRTTEPEFWAATQT